MFDQSTISQNIDSWLQSTGDQYISSWINTGLYFCAFIAAIYHLGRMRYRQVSRGERYFWLFLVILLFAMGLNKQFDFQTILIGAGRHVAQQGGWYEKRRLVQAWFAYAFLGMMVIFLLAITIRLSTREFWRKNTIALAGLGILLLYTGIRETSISHINLMGDMKEKGGYRLTDVIEMFGILCIFANSFIGNRADETAGEATPKTAGKRRAFIWSMATVVAVVIGAVVFFASSYGSFIADGLAAEGWRPRPGDSSFMGWVTVFSYYLGALICFLKLFSKPARQLKQERNFWITICCSMAAFGVIKQFNLFIAADYLLRFLARSGGWIEQRRIVQAIVMAVLGFFFLMAVFFVLRLQIVRRHKVTTIGLAYLLLFIILRGISLHQFEDLLRPEIFGVRVNWIAELTGICWVCLSSFIPAAQAVTIPAIPTVSAESPDDLVRSGIAFFKAGDARTAIVEFERAINIDPGNTEAYINRAEAYESLGDYRKMLADSDRAVTLDRESARAYVNRGLAYAMLEQYDQTIDDFKAAARLGHQEAQEALKKKGIDW